jgi:hypothetical protein
MPPPGPPIFLHIPKTAGTSLREALVGVYGEDRCLFIYEHEFEQDPDDLAAMQGAASQAAMVYGHMSHGVHRALGLEARYLAVVREPVGRVVSFFRHQARDPASEHFEAIADGMTMTDLLRSGSSYQMANHMTRILSGQDDHEVMRDRAPLERAMANIANEFVSVGLADEMDETISRMGQELGWAAPAVPSLNVDPNPPRAALDAATRAEILHHNALDAELYDRVRSVFKSASR